MNMVAARPAGAAHLRALPPMSSAPSPALAAVLSFLPLLAGRRYLAALLGIAVHSVQTVFFAVIGLTIPWAGWASLGWSGVALAIAVLLLRRIPPLLLLQPFLPQVREILELAA